MNTLPKFDSLLKYTTYGKAHRSKNNTSDNIQTTFSLSLNLFGTCRPVARILC